MMTQQRPSALQTRLRTSPTGSLCSRTARRDTDGTPVDRGIRITGKDTIVRVCRMRRPRGGEPSAATGSDMAVISAADLNRLKAATSASWEDVEEAEENTTQRRSDGEQKDQEKQKLTHFAAAAQARKEKIRQIDAARKHLCPPTQDDIKIHKKKADMNQKVQAMLLERTEDVRQMTQMIQRSKVAKIRNAQIADKRDMAEEQKRLERQQDEMIEAERLRGLKLQQELEIKRQEDQKIGAAVIVEQIKHREATKRLEEEIRESERRFVQKQVEAVKADELAAQKAKQEAARKLLDEVNAVNRAALRVKEEKKIEELEEDKRIAGYLREKDQKDREREAELQRQQAEKEKELSQLRARQESRRDKTAELDALRARRAAQASARQEREKERKQKERAKQIQGELAEARRLQLDEKEQRILEVARKEREEFERNAAIQIEREKAEKQKAERQRQVRSEYVEQIRKQIDARQQMSAEERRAFLNEGDSIRAQLLAERRSILLVKEQKLEELRKLGVPEVYCTELARKKISV